MISNDTNDLYGDSNSTNDFYDDNSTDMLLQLDDSLFNTTDMVMEIFGNETDYEYIIENGTIPNGTIPNGTYIEDLTDFSYMGMGILGWTSSIILILGFIFLITAVFLWWCRYQQELDWDFYERYYTRVLIKLKQEEEPEPRSRSMRIE
ncbi:unnamed protein product [Bursaphelenchus okinawaensis]|uniref:Uncharacterized protein n=1 Tax=Bursaphelenchus okinawaensis TaxID=465554 RepID=A0A811KAJ4_9BILA|nr:unnamed protein product [Bursaphelenchus okinawaensis]CAG9096359.1 unnamed protein product [Bursaphelenchus okinawaensis]